MINKTYILYFLAILSIIVHIIMGYVLYKQGENIEKNEIKQKMVMQNMYDGIIHEIQNIEVKVTLEY